MERKHQLYIAIAVISIFFIRWQLLSVVKTPERVQGESGEDLLRAMKVEEIPVRESIFTPQNQPPPAPTSISSEQAALSLSSSKHQEDIHRCAAKFLTFSQLQWRCQASFLSVGCGSMEGDHYNSDIFELSECCRKRIARHIAFIQCITIPFGVQSWPTHDTLLGALRTADMSMWDDAASLAVLVKSIQGKLDVTAFAALKNKGRRLNSPKNPLQEGQEKMQKEIENILSYGKYNTYSQWLRVEKELPPMTMLELCQSMNSPYLREYVSVVIWSNKGCAIMNKIIPSIKLNLIGYSITNEKNKWGKGEDHIKLSDIGFPNVHIKGDWLVDTFPTRPVCRMSGIPIFCPKNPIKHLRNLHFMNIIKPEDDYKIFVGKKRYSPDVDKKGLRQKMKPMQSNMFEAAGKFLAEHAKRDALKNMYGNDISEGQQDQQDFEWFTSDECLNKFQDTGNYKLFPITALEKLPLWPGTPPGPPAPIAPDSEFGKCKAAAEILCEQKGCRDVSLRGNFGKGKKDNDSSLPFGCYVQTNECKKDDDRKSDNCATYNKIDRSKSVAFQVGINENPSHGRNDNLPNYLKVDVLEALPPLEPGSKIMSTQAADVVP
jgi:hypothetical protein